MPRISLKKVYDRLFCGGALEGEFYDAKEISLEEFTKAFGESYKFSAIIEFIDPKNRPKFIFSDKEYNAKNIEAHINKAFAAANDRYKYFAQDDEHAFAIYRACYLVTQYSWHILGSERTSSYNDTSAESDIEFLSYKMLVIFGGGDISSTLLGFDKVAKETCQSQELQTRDLLEIAIPKCSDYGVIHYDLDSAKKAVVNKQITKMVLRFFTTLPVMQNKYGQIETDPDKFKDQLIGVKIPNAEKNLEFAKLCYQYGQADSFVPVIKAMDKGIIQRAANGVDIADKAHDDMPDFHVEYINEETGSKYHFVKLPVSNLRGLILGAISGNCQSYANAGMQEDGYILDCLHRPNSGFYVLVKEGKKKAFAIEDLEDLENLGHEIVGQTPAWLGENNEFSFEALQLVKDRSQNIDLQALLNLIGSELNAKAGIERFTIADYQSGISLAKNTYKSYGSDSQHTDFVSIKLAGAPYCCGIKQIEVFVSEGLDKSREYLESLTSIVNQSHITNITQAKAVQVLWESMPDDLDFLRENYVSLTNNYITSNWDISYLKSLAIAFKELHAANTKKFNKIFSALGYAKLGGGMDYSGGGQNISELLNLYRFGVKVDQLIDLPDKIIDFLFSEKITSVEKSPLLIGINIAGLFDKIKSAKNIVDVKKLIIKAVATEKCGEVDTEYIDNLTDARIDGLLESVGQVRYNFTSIKVLSELSDDIFEFIVKGFGEGIIFYYRAGVAESLDEILTTYKSLYNIQKYLLKLAIDMMTISDPEFNFEGKDFIDQLDPSIVDFLLASPYIEGLSYSGNIHKIVPSNDASNLEIVKNLVKSIASSISQRADEYISTLSDEEFGLFMKASLDLHVLLSDEAIDLYESCPKVTIEVLSQIPKSQLYSFLHNRDQPWWDGITLEDLIGPLEDASVTDHKVEHAGAEAFVDEAQ